MGVKKGTSRSRMNFDAAIARVASFGPQVQVSDVDKLSLYALFKQARNGDANDKDEPSRFILFSSAKFWAWKNLKGISREEAERQYVALVARLDPAWAAEMQEKQQQQPKNGSKVKVVTPAEERAILLDKATTNQHHQEENGMNGGDATEKPKRRQSLDQNFVYHLRSGSPPKLSAMLEKALHVASPNSKTSDSNTVVITSGSSSTRQTKVIEDSSSPVKTTTRPRARSLDLNSSFVIAPWTSIEEVGDTVKKLVLKPEDDEFVAGKQQQQHHRGRRVFDQLEGVGNVRDFGGLPALTSDGKPGRIRSNALLRCAQFNEATQQDAEFFLRKFGLRTIVDFRSADCVLAGHLSEHFMSVEMKHAEPIQKIHTARETAERLRISLPLITRSLVRTITQTNAPLWRKIYMLLLIITERIVGFFRRFFAALPLFDVIARRLLIHVERFLAMRTAMSARRVFVDSGLKALYTHMLLDGHQQLKPAIELVTDKAMHPAAFHCAFGKDRTGIVAALVLHALGVKREIILEDFEMSHHFVDTERGQKEWEHSVREMPELAQFKEEWARSPAAALGYALNEVEKRYGNLDAYFDKVLELDEQWRRGVRETLVEPLEDTEKRA